MAASVNKQILIGHLGIKPEERFFPDGTKHTRVSLATSENWKDKTTGEKKERTDWHYIVFIGRLAEIVCEYLDKGSLIYVEGSSRTRSYRPAGADKDVYVTEVYASTMKMLDRKPSDNVPASAPSDSAPPLVRNDLPPMDDDIPL